MNKKTEALRLFLVAGEESGDQLGGRLIPALRSKSNRPLKLSGVGGKAMNREGCRSLFSLSDIAVMGPLAIARRLPTLIQRVNQTVREAVDMAPHALVLLDSPEFTHAVAKRVRRKIPDLPVIDYVSPSVWAWRPGRARKMRNYIDHVLAILPFEPDVHKRLGGPDCTYVGHPLIERLSWMRSLDTKAFRKKLGLSGERPILAILPGSRTNEINRMMGVYGETLRRVIADKGDIDVMLPLAPGTSENVQQRLSDWPVQPHLVVGEEDKFTAFRTADAALATSGTVTLELSLAQTPMVVAYRADVIVSALRWLLRAHSFVLPNLILGKNVIPEFFQEEANPDTLADALMPLFDKSSAQYKDQAAALKGLKDLMVLPEGTPSQKAAEVILSLIKKKAH